MAKSRRLMELMMLVNRLRTFTVGDLAREFGVSKRTILRDLQELSALGVPLYSEVGPHGGYRILNERMLPPIAFTENEAVSIFFASHALRHYSSLPFEEESASALKKFYHYMPRDVRERIDELRTRIDFYAPLRHAAAPHLKELLEASISQRVVAIAYQSGAGVSERDIQPIGIYASQGFWYCPAYCFARRDYRLFRCDRLQVLARDAAHSPIDQGDIHLDSWHSYTDEGGDRVQMVVRLGRDAARRCATALFPEPTMLWESDGTAVLEQCVPVSELDYFATFFLSLGTDAHVQEPLELVERVRKLAQDIAAKYG